MGGAFLMGRRGDMKGKRCEMLSRERLANPFGDIPYAERLKKAGHDPKQEFDMVDLGNGYSKLVPVRSENHD